MLRVSLGAGLFILLFGCFTLAAFAGDELSFMSRDRYRDVTLLYALIPAYLLALSGLIAERRQAAVVALASMRGDPGVTIGDPTAWRWGAALAVTGTLYGFVDYPLLEAEPGELGLMMVLSAGNSIVWTSVGWFLGLGIANALYLKRLGAGAEVDIFNLKALKPVAAVASLNVFVTMGTLALMPIQSLSSPFRFEFYAAGFAVGIPAAVALFVVPQWGARQALRRVKAATLAAVNEDLARCDRADRVVFETLLAHRDRVLDTREWPVDPRVFSRAMLYLVVPPLAWVGAAIVERGVDQLF